MSATQDGEPNRLQAKDKNKKRGPQILGLLFLKKMTILLRDKARASDGISRPGNEHPILAKKGQAQHDSPILFLRPMKRIPLENIRI